MVDYADYNSETRLLTTIYDNTLLARWGRLACRDRVQKELPSRQMLTANK